MKKLLTIATLTSLIAVLSSCRKPAELATNPPVNNKPDTTSYLQLSISGAPASNEALFALASLETSTGQLVFTNKKLVLHAGQNVYLTDKLAVTQGAFRLTKLLLVTAADTALYAAPKAQTQKAIQVTAPLSLPVETAPSSVTTTSVQVLAIHTSDSPESYGYTAEDFGYFAFIRLRTTISIRVGTVLYDSLPGTVKVDAVDADGNHWKKELELAEGLNQISVPEKYASYRFEMSKWNTAETKNISRQQLRQNDLIAFSTSRSAKRLITENTMIETAAGYVTDSRTSFAYDNNQLSTVSYFQKRLDETTLRLSNVYTFIYNSKMLDTIKRYDNLNNLQGYTSFYYQNGRITNMHESNAGQSTGAAAVYFDFDKSIVVEADYLYHNGNTMSYRMVYRNGNKVSDAATSSTGGGETATYSYDSNVNPYYQLGYPDLLFARTSKNNLLLEQRSYSGNIPSAVPYKYEYAYNEDGYPEQKIVSFKGYSSGQHLYRMKTLFVYQ